MAIDGTSAGDIQTDTQLEATPDDAASAPVDAALLELHTSIPGVVQSFDPVTQTATVQPAIKRILTDDGPVALPACLDVPVYFPGGGGFVLTFPVAAGDECLLCFSERAIDFWFENGGVQLPSEFRLHDLSDAFAFVGFRSKPSAVKSPLSTGAELRSLDGATVVRVESGVVTAGNPANAVAAALATLQNSINSLVANHTHVTTCPAGPGTAAASVALADPPDVSAQNVKVS